MRKKPLKICARAGCGKKTLGRYCAEHKKHQWSEYDKTRPSSTKRGYDYAWSKFRKSYLERNPLCEFCKSNGFLTDATEVDHIVTLASNPSLKYDNRNLRPLCKPCHSARTWHDQSIGAKNGQTKKGNRPKAGERHF